MKTEINRNQIIKQYTYDIYIKLSSKLEFKIQNKPNSMILFTI